MGEWNGAEIEMGGGFFKVSEMSFSRQAKRPLVLRSIIISEVEKYCSIFIS